MATDNVLALDGRPWRSNVLDLLKFPGPNTLAYWSQSASSRGIITQHHRHHRMVVDRCAALCPLATSDINPRGLWCDGLVLRVVSLYPGTARITARSPPALIGLLVITVHIHHQVKGYVGRHLSVQPGDMTKQ